MPITAASVRRELDRRMPRLRMRVGDEINRLRLDAGLTLTQLGAATGLDRSHLARIEAGRTGASLDALVAIGIALGADLGVRFFAGYGPRLVDRFQAAMVEAFLRKLDARWVTRLEVGVDGPSRGVVDAALIEGSGTDLARGVAAEFQSQLRRVEQQIRWNNEKADGLAARLIREGRLGHGAAASRLLVLRSTTSTRQIARLYESTLRAAYPARATDLYRALTTPTAPWPGSGIVWMRVEGGVVSLLDAPPRGVRVGR